MKVVINKCYGGFGLSDEAILLYAKKKGITLYQPAEPRYSMISEFYTEEDCNSDSYWSPMDLSYEDENRSDPVLIEVVEELGEAANGAHASLSIVEIPDDIEWHIDEYDGIESIHENHRSWY